MQSTAKSLGIDRLSVDDRLRILEEIWDSIDVDALAVPEWHKDELDRRLDAYRKNPNAGASWEDVKARLFPGLGASHDHPTGG